ncbi:mediator of RNA polymerase II transcription subunit 8-like [Dendronephthya gigantea]|uniref:mediator of RNA polymerase II transcription subunit 8-like n=1 Tax=Dendronephthya gigantea TaxID=151771 RepID=UPI00106C4D7F|nr:mediator of RNA polymerase II transcription subunit 8-like [Dendronephthya gigantea]
MQDEKILETTLDALLNRVQDLKNSCQSFLMKIEHQQLTWPQVLDNFAVISGQVSTLFKVIKNDRIPVLRNLVLLPLLVQQEPDADLQKSTESRIQAFNHEVVPDHLRTKYEPEVEDKERVLSATASNMSSELTQRQIADFNATLSSLVEMISAARDDWETDQSSASKSSANVNADVPKLVGAITYGKGLSSSLSSGSSSSHKSSSQGRHSSSQRSSTSSSGKVSSAVKTELKTKVVDASSPYGTK